MKTETTLTHEVELKNRFDLDTQPKWAEKIERWYQLDELGYAFCEAVYNWNYHKEIEKPDLIFIAIEGASNIADKDFVIMGSLSPAKFVYTLPNISAAVIFQMLNINGKVYCLNDGPNTTKTAEIEAKSFASNGKRVWLFTSPITNNESEAEQVRKIIFKTF